MASIYRYRGTGGDPSHLCQPQCVGQGAASKVQPLHALCPLRPRAVRMVQLFWGAALSLSPFPGLAGDLEAVGMGKRWSCRKGTRGGTRMLGITLQVPALSRGEGAGACPAPAGLGQELVEAQAGACDRIRAENRDTAAPREACGALKPSPGQRQRYLNPGKSRLGRSPLLPNRLLLPGLPERRKAPRNHSPEPARSRADYPISHKQFP